MRDIKLIISYAFILKNFALKLLSNILHYLYLLVSQFAKILTKTTVDVISKIIRLVLFGVDLKNKMYFP